jgi:hypothetical protein
MTRRRGDKEFRSSVASIVLKPADGEHRPVESFTRVPMERAELGYTSPSGRSENKPAHDPLDHP